MSIWTLIVGAALGGPLGLLIGRAAEALGPGDLAQRRQVAFTIAAIALAAKMARADGHASGDEFAVFQRLFHVPPSERANAERFFRQAQRSTAGYEAYADQAAELLGAGSPMLEDLLDALFAIAAVDGFDGDELAYLDAVAGRFGFEPAQIARIRARHNGSEAEPYGVLGVEPGAGPETVRAAYRALVKAHHPDRHLGEGCPPEFIRVAEARMAAINAAYRAIARAPAPA